VIIGNDPETAEGARVAGKGSLVLDRPLSRDHPAGTLVVRVPAEYSDQIKPPSENTADGTATVTPDAAQESSSGGIDPPLIVGAVIAATLLATGGIVLAKRRSPTA